MSAMRRIGLSSAVLLLVLGCVEVGGAVLLRMVGEDELMRRLIDATITTASEATGNPNAKGVLDWEVLHPYLGYVNRPAPSALDAGLSLDALGFPNGGPFVTAADPRKMVIGVFGGSLAQFFVAAGGPERVFEDLAAGREMIVVSTAQGGYKQPQQLLALAYLLSLGMHFDALLLLDGFNEVALPVAENAKRGTFPFFPREWALRVAALDVATDVRSLVGEIAFRRELRRGIAASFQSSPLQHSHFASLVWLLYDRDATATIESRRRQLQELRPKSLEYLGTGPRWPSLGDALYRDLAEVWKRSAQQMDAICRANGIRFVQFLQPNQYVPGSKWMGPEERVIAINESHRYAIEVRKGYPHLQRAGEELRASGMPFHDLVSVFADTRETVYNDDCCHLNPRGNEILADAMVEQMRHDLEPPANGAIPK
jgi:hypothetical protein